MNKSTITFGYYYPDGADDAVKDNIDLLVTQAVTKAFWELYHRHVITDFYFIDEDMAQPTGEGSE